MERIVHKTNKHAIECCYVCKQTGLVLNEMMVFHHKQMDPPVSRLICNSCFDKQEKLLKEIFDEEKESK